MYTSTYLSPFGKISLVSCGKYIQGLSFQETNYPKKDDLEIFQKAKYWLSEYFKGKNPILDFPIELKGTDFQKEVWNILQTVPFSKTLTYGEIAKIIAKKRNVPVIAAQAVGAAIGKNPILIIIPCHRIIGANGSLIGYRGGLELKKKLLEFESSIK